jgi:transglutaminase-like putative cysteine protease
LVGFADEVTLGQSGFLSTDNRAVALRATVPRLAAMPQAARERELENLYWRGTVYDTYDHGHWARSRTPALSTELEPLGRQWMVKEPGFRPNASTFPPLANTVRQEIDIVGLQVPVAFGLDQPVAFELQDAQPGLGAAAELRLVPRWSSEVALRVFSRSGGTLSESEEGRTAGGAHYVVFSRDSLAHVSAETGVPVDELDPDLLRPYLALPPELSPRVHALANTITADKFTAAAKMQAVIAWLGQTHGYSTQLKRHASIPDPLEDFLFEQKAGHCEYFASAAAVLLRAAGVPTRYVNGFLGGEWNALGQHVTVRQNRAHSWTEAYLGQFGWVRVDATPPVGAGRSMSRLSELVDSLELWWSRWVVSYDFARQIDLARSLGKQLGFFPTSGPKGPGGISWTNHKQILMAGADALVLGFGLWQWRRRRPRRTAERIRRTPSGTPVGQLYEKALRRLAARGFARRLSETPREYLERARSVSLQGCEVLEQITTHYEDARFGGVPVEDSIVRALGRRIAELVPSAAGTGLTKTTSTTGS